MNVFTSFMRTIVPIVAGLLLSWLAKAGFNLDSTTVTMVVTSAITAGYYAVFRLAEAWANRIGWVWLRTAAGILLGWARPPQYPDTDTSTSTRTITAV